MTEVDKPKIYIEESLKNTLDESLKGEKPRFDYSCFENACPIDAAMYEQKDYTAFIAKLLKTQLADKVADILSTEDEYVVSMSPVSVYRDTSVCMFKIRVRLNHKPLIRCKNCKWWPENEDSPRCWCVRNGMYTEGEWYCADGRERTLDDYMIKKGDDLDGTA